MVDGLHLSDHIQSDLGPEHVDKMMVRRQGKFHCFKIIIKAPCECTVCTQQFRPASYQGRWTFAYTKALSDTEALKESMALVEGARKNFQYLKQQCHVNGSVIVKRWKKKSSEKRKALLLEVDPDMYPHQWSDIHFTKEFEPIKNAIASVGIEAWPDPGMWHLKQMSPIWGWFMSSWVIFHQSKWALKTCLMHASALETRQNRQYWLCNVVDATQGRARRPYRNVCLLPYINLESLKDDPARLLNILHNRVVSPFPFLIQLKKSGRKETRAFTSVSTVSHSCLKSWVLDCNMGNWGPLVC